MKVLIFLKGKPKPVLFDNVDRYSAQGSLTLIFDDTNELVIAEGQWREARVIRFGVLEHDTPPPEEESVNAHIE